MQINPHKIAEKGRRIGTILQYTNPPEVNNPKSGYQRGEKREGYGEGG